MIELWFALLTLAFTLFAVLDGWTIGAGALQYVVGPSRAERRDVVAAIGPLWSWHEVWLVVAGGTLLLAFPKALAVAFPGFYLALWFLLWSLILRGVALELGGHLADPLWQAFWDVVLAGSSLLLALLLGAALGNVVRGVPLDATGAFSMPLFTDFGVGGRVGFLDWFTLSVAAFTTLVLAAHGATYLGLAAHGGVRERSARLAPRLWLVALALFPAVSWMTAWVRPDLATALAARPVAWLAIVGLLTGACALWSGLQNRRPRRALAGSSAVLAGLLASFAASAFPVMLHSTFGSGLSLTAHQGAADERGLRIGATWWPVAFVMAFGYVIIVARAGTRARQSM